MTYKFSHYLGENFDYKIFEAIVSEDGDYKIIFNELGFGDIFEGIVKGTWVINWIPKEAYDVWYMDLRAGKYREMPFVKIAFEEGSLVEKLKRYIAYEEGTGNPRSKLEIWEGSEL